MADYRQDDWVPVVVPPAMTPREREFDKRIKELEQVVSKVAKVIWYDDSLTEAKPFMVTNTANTVIPAEQRVVQLEKANEDMRRVIEEKDDEIERLTDLANQREEKIDELNDKIYDITHILGV